MLAFAGNSLLCRAALKSTAIDAASFTAIRIAAGALALWLIVRTRDGATQSAGSWGSAAALFAYAAAFSYAYLSLSAATGALLLFGAVQTTMIAVGLWRGERLAGRQTAGLVCALAGLVGLLLPGLSAPPWHGALLMAAAGVAWGVYTLRGQGRRRSAAGHRRQLPARLRRSPPASASRRCRGPRSIRPASATRSRRARSPPASATRSGTPRSPACA